MSTIVVGPSSLEFYFERGFYGLSARRLWEHTEMGQINVFSKAISSRQELNDADGGSVRAVSGAERVVYVIVRAYRQFPRELGVVLFFLGMETQVFEEKHFTRTRVHRLC